MFIVGLTGGIATGKSTVCSVFREHGIPVIDADITARKVVEPGKIAWKKIKAEFGDEVIRSDGQIDRSKLGDIIFKDIEKRKKLNAITHPEIYKEIGWQAFKYFLKGYSFIVMDLPLLFESGKLVKYMHKIIVVTCEEDIQLQRLMERSGISEANGKERILAQMPQEKKMEMAHFVIDNSSSELDMREQTIKIINVLKSLKYHRQIRLIIGLCCTVLVAGTYWMKSRFFKPSITL